MTSNATVAPNRRTLVALAVTAALFLSFRAVAAEGSRSGLTIEDVARLKNVSSAEISPDGSLVAYVLTVPRTPFKDEDGPAWQELHLVDVTGASRPYVTGKVNVSRVEWTPDGRSIAFLSKRAGDEENCLYAIPIAGGEARKILSHEAAIGDYSFAPDGAQVAFVATDKEPKRKKTLSEKGFKAEVYEEDLRPGKVFVARPFDDAPDAKPKPLPIEGSAAEVRFAPDGKRLAVVVAPTPLVDDSMMERRIRVIDAETGALLASVENPGKLGAFEWSPDSTRIAMLAGADVNDPSTSRLLVADASGGVPKDVLSGMEGDVESFAWQNPDEILFLAERGVETSLEKVRRDGAGHKTIFAGGGPALSRLSLSSDGMKGAMTGSTSAFPGEAFAMSHGETAPRQLTNSNEWLAGVRLAPQAAVPFWSRDKLPLEGILIRPLDEKPGEKYPLVLVVHGGPEAHYRNGWLTSYSSPGQVAAARGYAVFYPNYRGSTGRGVAFSKSSQGDPAGKEFDDLVDAVDHLVATGLVDGKKVGVTGGSYGGYATAWCSTRLSERFAAGVMFVGISDLVSKSGTTDIPNEMYLVHQRKRVWEDWEFFLERSPVRWVESARTPLLLLHGKNDTRVHPSQSLELYRQLKIRGQAPVRLVHYPGEGHGNRNDAARYDYALRSMQWFDHYLKGPGGAPPPPDLDYPLEQKEDATKEADPVQ